jgi:hypothetical protein
MYNDEKTSIADSNIKASKHGKHLKKHCVICPGFKLKKKWSDHIKKCHMGNKSIEYVVCRHESCHICYGNGKIFIWCPLPFGVHCHLVSIAIWCPLPFGVHCHLVSIAIWCPFGTIGVHLAPK